MTKSGYQLREEAYHLLSEAGHDEETGEVDPEFYARLDTWCDSVGDKLAAYRAVRSAAMARSDDFKSEAARWAAAKKRQDKTAERISDMALELLRAHHLATGANVIVLADGDKVRLQSRKSTRVEVADANELEPYFQNITANKSLIKMALKAGNRVANARLVDSVSEFVRWG